MKFIKELWPCPIVPLLGLLGILSVVTLSLALIPEDQTGDQQQANSFGEAEGYVLDQLSNGGPRYPLSFHGQNVAAIMVKQGTKNINIMNLKELIRIEPYYTDDQGQIFEVYYYRVLDTSQRCNKFSTPIEGGEGKVTSETIPCNEIPGEAR
jgi:hypothetical protein